MSRNRISGMICAGLGMCVALLFPTFSPAKILVAPSAGPPSLLSSEGPELSCAAAQAELQKLEAALMKLENDKPHQIVTALHPGETVPPASNQAAIAAWHTQNDAQVNTLEAELNSTACGGPPPVPPDVAFQFSLCLDVLDTPSHPDIPAELQSNLNDFLSSLKAQSPTLFPNPNALIACVNGKEAGGLWLNHAADPAALKFVDMLPPGQTFGFEVTAPALDTAVAGMWAQIPKRFDPTAPPDPSQPYGITPNPNGEVELKTYSLQFISPNRVVLTFNGVDHNSVNLNITATYTDTISLSQSVILCQTATNLNVHADWLEAVLSAFIPFPFSLEPLVDVQEQINASGLPLIEGPGCLASQALPNTILLARTNPTDPAQKVVFPYNSLNVSPAVGILASGGSFPELVTRAPLVAILGASDVIVWQSKSGSPVQARFVASTTDMRGNVALKWSTTRGTIIQQQDSFVVVQYPAPHGSVGTKVNAGTVSVQATDADGLQTGANMNITLDVKPTPKLTPTKQPIPTIKQP
jgi:hypothetical protein